jgi:hypothetical protein
MAVGGQRHAPTVLPLETPGTHCTGRWLASEPVWTDAENFALTEIRSPDRSARSESPIPSTLYRLALLFYNKANQQHIIVSFYGILNSVHFTYNLYLAYA